MGSTDVKNLLQRYDGLKNARGPWENHWQDIAEVFYPNRADFTRDRQGGERRASEIYDSIPMQARRGLASAIDGLLKPKTSKWFFVRASDQELNDDDAAKRWLEEVEKRMYAAIYARKARFIQNSGEVDNSLVAFGTGILFIGEPSTKDGLLFESFALKNCFLAENSDGQIDTLYIRLQYTARQAKQKWGDKVGEKVNQKIADNKENDVCEYVWAIFPRNERNGSKRDNKSMAYASVVMDVDGETIVNESGFEEFPFAVPRWETIDQEVYGRSPAMVALPDALGLQQMGKTLLRAGQIAVDPPIWALDDAVIGIPRTYPGGMTYIDGEAARSAGTAPFGVMEFGKNMPLGREMQNDTREQIWAAFFRNVLQLPVDAPSMTATEVLERKEEYIRVIGPVFGQLEADYPGHIVDRVFNIMARAGAFPDAPESLQGRDIKFEFQSPIQQARKQIEVAGLARAFEIMAPLMQVQPEIADRINGDEIIKDLPEGFGMPMKWMRSDSDVEKIRTGRQQAMAAQQQMAAIQAAGGVAKDIGAAAGSAAKADAA